MGDEGDDGGRQKQTVTKKLFVCHGRSMTVTNFFFFDSRETNSGLNCFLHWQAVFDTMRFPDLSKGFLRTYSSISSTTKLISI
jgi:hypothetical protein